VSGVYERVFGLRALDSDRFESDPVHDDVGDAYGGEILARSLWAMGSTVPPGRLPHSVQAYYLRPAQNGETTSFAVSRERDGRSFSTRRATAIQRGKDMFLATAGFHSAPPPDSMQAFDAARMPEVAEPTSIPPRPTGPLLLDVRMVKSNPGASGGTSFIWARTTDEVPEDPVVHLCLLAYFSDLSNAFSETPIGGDNVITLDHVMWFHRPIDMSTWVLMHLEPVVVASGRGTYRGRMYDQSGHLVASFVQEMFAMVRSHNL
jgi:acyl-CoA thioesterase II